MGPTTITISVSRYWARTHLPHNFHSIVIIFALSAQLLRPIVCKEQVYHLQ